MTSLHARLMVTLGDRTEIAAADLSMFLERLTGLSGAPLDELRRATDDAIAASIGADGTLHARPGGWVFRLGTAAATGVLATAVTAGVLAAAGFDQLPGLVLPAVIPLLVDIERVRLSKGDRHLLAELRLQPDVVGKAVDPAALYDRLPVSIRDEVSRRDFLDFVEHLVIAGEADESAGGEVALRAADDAAWIRIRLG